MAKPYGLPKSALLRSEKEISTVFRLGRHHSLGVLQAKVMPAQSGTTRFMVSVRKSVGHAPLRNRVRRLVKEVMRRHRQSLESPHDICFFLTRRPDAMSFRKLEQEVLELFRRLSGQD